jgi:hypothetical protein
MYAHWRERICGNALRDFVLQLSEASELGSGGHGHGVLPGEALTAMQYLKYGLALAPSLLSARGRFACTDQRGRPG